MFEKCQVDRIFAIRSYSNIEHLLHHTRPEHSYTPFDASKPNKHTYTSLKRSQTPLPDIYGQFRTTKVTDRHQQTSQHIPRHPMRLFEDVWRFMLRLNDVCWCLLVFVGVCWCLILSYVVWRCAEGVWIVSQKVSECCLWTCKCLGSCEGVSECSGLVGCSNCSILEYLRKAKLHPPDTFETSKYQNRPI